MVLDIGGAIDGGVRRSASVTGVVLMVLTFVYQLVFLGSINTIFSELLPAAAQAGSQIGLTFPLSTAVAGGLALVAMIFGMLVFLGAVRALVRDVDEQSTVPTELFTRRTGRALLSLVGANIVVSLAVMIGFALFFVPGLYLAVSFIFVVFAIGVEDERAIDAMRRSWTLATGNRWHLFGLFVIVTVVMVVASSLGTFVSFVDPAVGQVVNMALTAVFSIVGYGILADAYVQVRDEHDGDDGGTADSTDAATAV